MRNVDVIHYPRYGWVTNIVRMVLFHELSRACFPQIGGGMQSVASDSHNAPGSCHGKVVTAQAPAGLVSAAPVVSSLIELCTLL